MSGLSFLEFDREAFNTSDLEDDDQGESERNELLEYISHDFFGGETESTGDRFDRLMQNSFYAEYAAVKQGPNGADGRVYFCISKIDARQYLAAKAQDELAANQIARFQDVARLQKSVVVVKCCKPGRGMYVRNEIAAQRLIDPNGRHNAPNILPIFDSDPLGIWITMPYCNGGDLLSYVRRLRAERSKDTLPLCFTMHVVKEVAKGLLFLHKTNGFGAHTDLHAGNIMVHLQDSNNLPRIFIGDFGRAVFGAMDWRSDSKKRSDWWALGNIFHGMAHELQDLSVETREDGSCTCRIYRESQPRYWSRQDPLYATVVETLSWDGLQGRTYDELMARQERLVRVLEAKVQSRNVEIADMALEGSFRAKRLVTDKKVNDMAYSDFAPFSIDGFWAFDSETRARLRATGRDGCPRLQPRPF